MHMGGSISALAVVNGSEEVAKDMAMQVASMNPKYISQKDVPADVLEHETHVQKQIMDADESLANKPEKVLAGILRGKISKHFRDVCLMDQEYFKDPKEKVAGFLKANKAEIVTFVRFQAGEGIEKREENFAEEVMSQING